MSTTGWRTIVTRARAEARAFGKAGLDLLFPPRCMLCDEELADDASEVLFCSNCCRHVVDPHPRCLQCGARIGPGVAVDERCGECVRRRFQFRGVVALGSYRRELRAAVLRMKHYTGEALSMTLGEVLWRERGPQIETWQPSAVVPVSMHWARRLVRQTNSAELLAGVLARRLGIPMQASLLRRTRRTRPQAGLSASRRRFNMRGAFAVRRWRHCRGERFLLVDDVLTTGSTASEAARALLKSGASCVFVAVLARGEGED